MKIKKLLITTFVIFLLVIPIIFAIEPTISFEADKTITTNIAVLTARATDFWGNMKWIRIYKNNQEIGYKSCAGESTFCTFILPVIEPEPGTFSYYAKASNGEVEKSQTIQITFYGLDLEPPQYANINPTSPHSTTFGALPLDLSVEWTDNIDTVTITHNFAGPISTETITSTTDTYTYTINNLNVGEYTWHTTATDISGSQTSTPDQTLTVTDDIPTIDLVAPTDGEKIIDINGDVTFTYIASDNFPLVSCQLILDNLPLPGQIDTVAPFDIFFEAGISQGTHTWNVECEDNIGQTATATSDFAFIVPVRVDLTGAVTDFLGSPLQNIEILVDSSSLVPPMVTDALGEYTISNLEDQTIYEVTATDASATYVGSTQQITTNGDSVLNFILIPSSCIDFDGDGYYVGGGDCGPADCNDVNALINPGAAEVCDNLDNNCDSIIDEINRACGTNIGMCQSGTQTCSAGIWGSCAGCITPSEEICGDNLDNDCDGVTDETCYPEFQYSLYIPGDIIMDTNEVAQLIFPDTAKYYAALQAFSPTYLMLGLQSGLEDLQVIAINPNTPTRVDLGDHDLLVTYNGIESNKASISFGIPPVIKYFGASSSDGNKATYPGLSIIRYVKEGIKENWSAILRVKQFHSFKLLFEPEKEEATLAIGVIIFLSLLTLIIRFTERKWDQWL